MRIRNRGVGDIVPLYVEPGPDGDASGLPLNVQAPIQPLAPAVQAFLQGFIGTPNSGAAAEDPTGLTTTAYPQPGAYDAANVYGANAGYTDDVYSSLMHQGQFTGTMTAPQIRNKIYRPPVGGFIERPVIIPDSHLPGPLKRISPLTDRLVFERNRYADEIQREMSTWAYIQAHGGLKSVCRIPELGAPVYDVNPRLEMPRQGQDFRKFFMQTPAVLEAATPVNAAGDVVLGQFRCPNGYDGVLTKVVFGFTGDGHVEGSGDIVWRIQIGQRFARDLGNVQITYGTFSDAWLAGGASIEIISGQTVTVYVNLQIPTFEGTGPSPISGGMIQAGCYGWFYPRR